MKHTTPNPLIKNNVYEIEITGMTADGSGVGRAEGVAVFVPLSAVGDRLRVKIVKLHKSYAYGIIEEILLPSPDRVEADCPVYKKCGGCVFRHISYAAELRLKDGFVRDAFTRIGGLSPQFEPPLGCDSPDRYRNKAQYPVGTEGGRLICGFYSPRSHRVISCTDCLLQPAEFSVIAGEILGMAEKLNIKPYNEKTGKGILRHIYLRKALRTGELMLCLVSKKTSGIEALFSEILSAHPEITSAALNINPDNTNIILGKEYRLIAGSPFITDILCENKIEISPASFYQVNTEQAEKLYAVAKKYAGELSDAFLLDLYCGTGTIGLSMARGARHLTGVEIVREAVENARLNAENNGITNAEFIHGDAGKITSILAAKGGSPDVIILDPPRKGCDAQTISAVIKMNPGRIVMISCNPSTAARDCLALTEAGYTAERVRAVDMFPRTSHVETVVMMSKVEK